MDGYRHGRHLGRLYWRKMTSGSLLLGFPVGLPLSPVPLLPCYGRARPLGGDSAGDRQTTSRHNMCTRYPPHVFTIRWVCDIQATSKQHRNNIKTVLHGFCNIADVATRPPRKSTFHVEGFRCARHGPNLRTMRARHVGVLCGSGCDGQVDFLTILGNGGPHHFTLLNSASGLRARFPGPVWGRFGPEA